MIDMIPIPDPILLPDRDGPEFPWNEKPAIDDPILPEDPGDEPDDEEEGSS
ncbi:MAG: hypothetical protein M1529_01930 [Candidatus Thermoplasmatota archaeon]|jgi:hypothetical protein|nr:hypothetical protein [Candidatus Thermoplasmatota archaeon]